ncbi:hypothetical protein FEM48_Zijuj05G0046200 [Ziziphus jujuba var. spinosa]|uniref:SWI/SNF complex subunit SWI3A n=1 Tax=Ziziphus jujuba var. spinosa TaxID=714518 RepID=A0A978VCV2_ZIZJJ|nr:hypothetical protein FEM48_Zijuj05G0046200 [Ziziphus jujuba var. spinosa]
MELTQQDTNSKENRPEDPELDLYTIPSHSSWFSWDEIHETEEVALKEFFDGSSITRTPKIYKEYRDFIINKYREEPSRRLTFTEVRKSLVGDVCLLQKVFRFLENWGLINFAASSSEGEIPVVGDDERSKVKIEEGVPNGIRVVAMPNSIKPISALPSVGNSGDAADNGFKMPALASYSDVFAELMKHRGLVCGNCGEVCDSGHYKCTKDDLLICVKCFKNGNYGESKSVDDYKFNECFQNSGNHGALWTEAETLLLLESVLKHGDDWELVAQNVHTKTKMDCIAKLIEMPFGEIMLGSVQRKGNSSDLNGNLNNSKQVHLPSAEHQENAKSGVQHDEQTNENELSGDTENEGPPLKRKRIASLLGDDGSLMKQVAHISTMVGPHITAAAAEATIASLCEENSLSREIFDGEDECVTNGLLSPTADYEAKRYLIHFRVLEGEDSEIKERSSQSEDQDASCNKDDIPLTLRIRAAVATALGTAAARAKLLADQEDREVEHLLAIIIGTQMKKLNCKIKHFEHLEMIMKKKHAEMEELEEFLISERISVLQRALSAGVPRWRGHSFVKY